MGYESRAVVVGWSRQAMMVDFEGFVMFILLEMLLVGEPIATVLVALGLLLKLLKCI